MKQTIHSFVAVFALIASISLPAFAEDKGHKHEKAEAGPNGGRVITSVEPHLEFYVTPERTVQVTVLTEDLKAAPLGKESVTVTAGDRSNPTKLTLVAKDGKLVSEGKLPDGEDIPVVVQIKVTPDAKAVNEKLSLNLAKCPTCKVQEYACVCEH